METKEETNQEVEITTKEEKTVKKKSKKKIIIVIICILIILLLSIIIINILQPKEEPLPKLPLPQITDGVRGELGIDKNINEKTIDNYLGRSDSVYRDMRLLEDPAKYENIGGDRFLSGYIKGFEVISLPYLIPVGGLPEEVGDTYTGETLFHIENDKYVANYKESMKILEKIFPKDKNIFLMCGGGGYAGMTKSFLVSMGWDENKIYNIGGHWYYKGKNNIEVPKNADGSYDFSNVPYHKIDFNKLKKASNYKSPNIKVSEVKLNTDKIELEEGTSFKLNVIVLPNEATNKEVKWISENPSIAVVDSDGLVKAIKEGTSVIKVESVDGKKTANCEVIIKKKKVSQIIELDNISNETNEFNNYDIDMLYEEFNSKIGEMSEGNKYYTKLEDGGYKTNELWDQEYNEFKKVLDSSINKRIEILNRLIDNQKSFIILIYSSECDVREYEVKDGAQRILDQNGLSYIKLGKSDSYEILEKSNFDLNSYEWGPSVVIMKKGTIYAMLDPNKDSIKSDEETKNWLSKYISVK